jgi:hypothetical protein
MNDAIMALSRVEEIQEQINPLMVEATELKKAATEFAVSKGIDVVQLEDVYYRQIQRYNKKWIGTRDEIPINVTMPKGTRALYDIAKGRKVKINGKKRSLWSLLTRRVPDPEKINEAVGKGWIEQDEVEAAFIEIPQQPFLQRFTGEAE